MSMLRFEITARRMLAVLSFWLGCSLVATAPRVAMGQNVAQQEARAKFRESITLDLDSQILKSLGTAQDHITDKNWQQAIPLLQRHIDDNADVFVPVEPGRYTNVADFCHALIARFPDEGLKLYRGRVDPIVRDWFESGRRNLDERQLRRVVQSGFNSSFGDDALWLLGELAFERGDIMVARTHWEHLLPARATETPNSPKMATSDLTYPDTSFPAAEVAARLILCSFAAGDVPLGVQELTAFRTLYPGANGHLAGSDGDLAEILERVRIQAAKWNSKDATTNDWVTLGGSNSRSSSAPKPVTALGLNWSTTLPSHPYYSPGMRMAFKERAPLSFYPVVWKGAVFVSGPESVHAINLETGGPLWPNDEADSTSIYSNVGEVPVRPNLETVGVASYTATIDRGRLFTRLGPPIVRRSRNETHTFSEIIGLDLEAQGRLCFQRSASMLDGPEVSPEATGWSFEGTPVVEGGKLWVSARRGVPEEEIVVLCFDVESSQLLWRRRLCSVLRNSPEHINIIGHRLLTLADGRLFVETGAGAIAALDADSGRVQWLATYESSREDSPIELNDPQRYGLAATVVADGLLFAAPADSSYIFAFDAATGRLIWQQVIPDRVLHLMGVSDHKLILSGRKLWALDTQNGRTAWPDGRVGFDDPRGFGYGRGILADNSVYWSQREELLRVDVRSGKLLGRWSLQEALGETGGNLVIANGLLLIAQAHRLVALGEPIEIAEPQTPKVGVTQPLRSRTSQMEFPTSPLIAPGLGTPSIQGVSSKPPAASPWPVRRLWSRTLRPSDKLLVSTAAPNGSGLAVIQSAQHLTAIDPRSGTTTWTGATAESLSWMDCSNSTVFLGSERGLSARHLDSGRLAWSAPLMSDERSAMREFRLVTGSPQAVRSTASNVVLCGSTQRLIAIDANTGRWYWQITPSLAQAATHSGSLADLKSSRLFFRPTAQGRVERFDLESWRSLKPLRLPADASRLFVVQASEGDPRLLTLSGERLLQCWSETGSLLWKYDDRISASHQPPEIKRAGEIAILIEDGLFARRLEVNSGNVLWSQALSRFPLTNVADSVALSRGSLLCVTDGMLNRFRLTDGTLSWRQYLGPGHWQLAVSPVEPPTAIAWMGTSKTSSVVACEEESGDLIQLLELPPTDRTRPLHVLGDQLLFAARDELIGLGSRP